SLDDLKKQLQAKGVSCEFKIAEDGKRGGISFGCEYEGQLHPFRGSSLDRQLSFGWVLKTIEKNFVLQKKGRSQFLPETKNSRVSLRQIL
ncbi:MAG: hypothetical protein KBS81_03955, partial [Spirochaetales bacterium]|nr:hypothetical protein [Candidatus Physcosoma equi]